MSTIQIVESKDAPAAVGPYSQATILNGIVYTSGQLGLIPATGEFPADNAAAQAEQALQNLKAVLAEAGTDISKVAKTLIFLADMKDFAAVNEVYASHFSAPYPARSCVQAAALPLGAKVEIEAIAVI